MSNTENISNINNTNNIDEFDIEKLIKIVRLVTTLMLESGAEAYRVESTCEFICKAYDVKSADSIATPTGIYITISAPDSTNRTVISRIKKRGIDLTKLNCVNTISRKLVRKEISLDEAFRELNNIKNGMYIKNSIISNLYLGLSAAFFVLLFEGGWLEALIGFVTGLFVQLISTRIEKLESNQFFSGFFSAMIITLISIIAAYINKDISYNVIIVGSITPLLPGLAMTNAIRDTMRGDLVSGVARAMEALLVAAALASGAGVIMSFYYALSAII